MKKCGNNSELNSEMVRFLIDRYVCLSGIKTTTTKRMLKAF